MTLGNRPVAVVTGGAGGIGRAIASLLSTKGYRMALIDVNDAGLNAAMEELGEGHLRYCVDITDKELVQETARDLFRKTGRVDVLVNNAGMVIVEPFPDCTVERLEKEFALNYVAALYCTKAMLEYMLTAGEGVIVSVASLAAILPLAQSPGYSASKFALRGLMLSLHMAMKPRGIHVGCVCPSAVDTPLLHFEATNGGSALNFLQEPLSPAKVAEAVWSVIREKKMEVCVPAHEGVSCKLGGLIPSVLPKLLPWLERVGERNRMKYIQRKALKQR